MEYKMRDYRFPFGNMIFDLYLSTLIICISDFSLLKFQWIDSQKYDVEPMTEPLFWTILQFCECHLWVSAWEGRGWISLTTFNKTFSTFQTYVSKGHSIWYAFALLCCSFVLVFISDYINGCICLFCVCIPFRWTKTRLDEIIRVETKQHELCNSIDSKLQCHVDQRNIVAIMTHKPMDPH